MRKTVLAALILALAILPAHANNTERKRNAEKPDYDAYKRELAFEMALIPEGQIQLGKPVNVLLKLVDTKSGLAVPASFLKHTNGHPFHLLLVDTTLTDYQHIHPSPTDTDGLYRFTFTPKKPGGYKAWAHVLSITDKPQFVATDLGRINGQGVDKKQNSKHRQHGYNFTLSFDNPPEYKKRRDGEITITDSAGNAITPDDMYIVGFHEDLRTILKVKFEEDSLTKFEIKPTEPGFVRLFAYVTIGNKPFIVPFGFNVGGKKSKPFKFKSIF